MYYLIEIVTLQDSVAKAIWEKSSMEEAVQSFHQTIASAMANDNAISCLCMVIDECGKVHRSEYWSRETEEE